MTYVSRSCLSILLFGAGGGGSRSITEISHLDAASCFSATPRRARHLMSNAAAQDGCWCSVSRSVGGAALSQTAGVWQLTWEAGGAGGWSVGLTLSAAPRWSSSQETKARNLKEASNVEGLVCLSLAPSPWLPAALYRDGGKQD